ncbi:MAG: S-layer homology domain-containing protein [Tissierellia bacterium]|nr:S-layer homology domain-containing protein [Tissierellia bacterium]MDD4780461.1 S-layer homology domain-containing protein [Tissierellia bacterium]
MKAIKKVLSVFVVSMMIITSMVVPAFGTVDGAFLDDAIKDTAAYIYKTVSNPQVGSICGEWAIIGLARSGYDIPEEYYKKYYSNVEKYVTSLDGNLHDKKYTEYSRLIVALTSIGKDPSDVAGYNLLTALGDYDKTIWQGLNGPMWALIALDSGNYDMPQNPNAKTQATRDMYIQRILDCQLPDGGWSLFGGTSATSSDDGVSDPDITGMALQALAKYQDREDVKKASDEALACMSKQQNSKAGFSSWGTENSESCVQMIVALSELGVSLEDSRFIKNGKTMLDNLMTFYLKGNGFLHTADSSGSSQMASEQGFYGLIAAQRLIDGKNSLYRMSDSLKIDDYVSGNISGEGLPGKNKYVVPMPIIAPGRTFDDIAGVNAHKNQVAIESLASRGIINGKTESTFDPDATMTRGEFAAIIVQSLGLKPLANDKFTDVSSEDWYAPYIGTANSYGIVNGITDKMFDPNGTITKQQAAAMVARGAKLCGLDTEIESGAVRDILAQFVDYVHTDDWAREAIAFCYKENILDQSELEIEPHALIIRSEIAQMLFNMLGKANLL